nr:DivIVA domain-containing protein [Micromonospora sp. DSM 115978]
MGQFLLLLVVALTVAAVVFGVTVLVTGNDPGLAPAEPDARAIPLPGARPLVEADLSQVRFDTTVRGYRMAQVDQALRRAAYDIGYKDELIGVLEAEVTALREGRESDADALRRARRAALVPAGAAASDSGPVTTITAGADAPRSGTNAAPTDAPAPATADSAPAATADPATADSVPVDSVPVDSGSVATDDTVSANAGGSTGGDSREPDPAGQEETGRTRGAVSPERA